MMKALFLIFHGFEEFNGISKKIRYQVEALKECGLDVRTCWLDDSDNHKRRMIDDTVLRDYGDGVKGKILKRIEFDSIVDYVRREKIEFIYVRYVHNASPFTIRLMKHLKQIGARIVMEIPTYPYDQEYKGLSFAYQRILFMDKCFRKKLAGYVDRIVTFSDYRTIWGRPTIRISNGIDFNQIPVKRQLNDTSKVLNLIAVATMHPWHGFERIIYGMNNYCDKYVCQGTDLDSEGEPIIPDYYKIHLHIVGCGVPEVVDGYKKEAHYNLLDDCVFFYGALFGKELDAIFDKADMGVGSLARHRSGIDKIKTLKNREYAARGIPFVYSETDDDFDNRPYVLKVPANDDPLDMDALVDFYRSVKETPEEIRQSIEGTLSWKNQMQIVLNETFSDQKP